MASIEVRRGNDAAGYFRRIKITLDGVTVVRLRPGKSATVTLPSGVHQLGGAMDWVRSEDILVNADTDDGTAYEFSLPFSFDGLKRKGLKARRL